MKKFIIGFITGIFILTPALAFSAPSLSARLKGRILLAVEDMGKTYYVAPDGYRYLITRATAQKVFEKLALGINNKNLEQIPVKEIVIDPEIIPEPQVAGDSARVIEKVVEKIIYVDRYLDKQCPDNSNLIESYKNEISDLNKQISLLKEQNVSGQTVIGPVKESKNALKTSLNKEYALKINELNKKSLEISNLAERISIHEPIGDLRNLIIYWIHPEWGSSKDIPEIPLSTYQHELIEKMKVDLVVKGTNDTREGVGNFLGKEGKSINNQVKSLQNELERKLLELE